MINKPPPFKGLNIGIPIITPIKGRGFMNQGSTLGIQVPNSYTLNPKPVRTTLLLPKTHVPNYWVLGPSGVTITATVTSCL